jgi:preprotein translocase subunit SecG
VSIVITILTLLLVLLSIGLITVVTMQTPKSEGFAGGVQNTPSSNFRGKAGYDDMLSGYTRMIGIGWFATAFLLAILNEVVTRR